MAEVKNRVDFEVEINGKKHALAVVRPSVKVRQTADLEYNKAFAKCLKDGLILEGKLNSIIESQGIWSDEKEAKRKEITERLVENSKIVKGEKATGPDGKAKLSDMRAAALKMIEDRAELTNLLSELNEAKGSTAQSQANNTRFNHLLAMCTLGEDGSQYYKSVQDYLERENDPVGPVAATKLMELIYDYSPEQEKKLPEYEFLLKHKFCDNELRLIDKQGRYISADGKLVDKDFRYIDEKGNLIDVKGRPVDKEGNYLDVVKVEVVDDTV